MIDLTNYNKSHYPSNVKITMKIAKYTEISEQEYLDCENPEKYNNKQHIHLKDVVDGVEFWEKLYGPDIFAPYLKLKWLIQEKKLLN